MVKNSAFVFIKPGLVDDIAARSGCKRYVQSDDCKIFQDGEDGQQRTVFKLAEGSRNMLIGERARARMDTCLLGSRGAQ